VEKRNELLLQALIEVDQKIAATDQIEPRKGRVARHVVSGENAQISNYLGNLVVPIELGEVALQPLR
jgi:hypothetical protein